MWWRRRIRPGTIPTRCIISPNGIPYEPSRETAYKVRDIQETMGCRHLNIIVDPSFRKANTLHSLQRSLFLLLMIYRHLPSQIASALKRCLVRMRETNCISGIEASRHLVRFRSYFPRRNIFFKSKMK